MSGDKPGDGSRGLSDLMCIPVKLMEGNLVGNSEDFLVGN